MQEEILKNINSCWIRAIELWEFDVERESMQSKLHANWVMDYQRPAASRPPPWDAKGYSYFYRLIIKTYSNVIFNGKWILWAQGMGIETFSIKKNLQIFY